MHAERAKYSLWVATVAKPSGAYLTDAQLHIVDLTSKVVVVERTMDGPWFIVALPPGRYEVAATLQADGADKPQTLATKVSIPRSGQRQSVLRFDSTAEVSVECKARSRAILSAWHLPSPETVALDRPLKSSDVQARHDRGRCQSRQPSRDRRRHVLVCQARVEAVYLALMLACPVG